MTKTCSSYYSRFMSEHNNIDNKHTQPHTLLFLLWFAWFWWLGVWRCPHVYPLHTNHSLMHCFCFVSVCSLNRCQVFALSLVCVRV